MNFLPLAAPEVGKMTTSDAASDEKFVNAMTFPSQCWPGLAG